MLVVTLKRSRRAWARPSVARQEMNYAITASRGPVSRSGLPWLMLADDNGGRLQHSLMGRLFLILTDNPFIATLPFVIILCHWLIPYYIWFSTPRSVVAIMPNFASPPPSCTVAELSFPSPFVMLVTISRERAMNSIPMAGHWEGQALWDWYDNEPSLRAAIVTGKGTKSFSAGADLLEVKSLNADGSPRTMPPGSFFGISRRIGKKPIIAAVNGYAFGGGFEIALNWWVDRATISFHCLY